MHFRKLSRKGQRHILTPVKHLTWSFLVKILKVVPYFYKSSILHVWQSSTAKAPSCMHDKVQTQKLHLACITKFSHKPPSCMYDKIQPQKLHLACMTKFNHKSSTLHVWQSSTTKVPSCMYHKVQPQKLHLACVTKFNHKSSILHVWQSSTTKALSCMYDKVQNMSLQVFIQDALREELAIAPVIECLNNNCLAKASIKN